MYTDWVLTHRLALELTQRFAGGRVQAAGQLPDGRFALQIWQRSVVALAVFDVFAATPVITVEDSDLTIEAEPGFVRRAGAALRGMTIDAVRSRKGDRVVRIDFAARSRFGVESGYAVIAELVPKFGNLLLIKDQTIVSALKEFSGAQNTQRSIVAGDLYEPPPLSIEPSSTEADFIRALENRERNGAPNRAMVAAFRALVPLLPQMAALSLLTEAFRDAPRSESAHILALRLMERADAFFVAMRDAGAAPVHVYRDEGQLVQAHITPLHQFDELEHETEESLLPLLAESRSETVTARESDRIEKRRRALARTLREREERLRKELLDVDRKLERSADREALREEGRKIFATLHEHTPEEQEVAKENAAELFARYRKVTSSLPHLRGRHAELSSALDAVLELQWELERARDVDLDDVSEAVAHGDTRKSGPVRKNPTKKRKPLTVTTPAGSRILIGRSPVENAELTFHVARPDDLWFHAQKTPGAHVILQRDDKRAASDEDLRTAASYAAFYSKAKASPRVLVDYTQRKHVRKRPAAAPGLVFYTNPKSITVEPREPAQTDASPDLNTSG